MRIKGLVKLDEAEGIRDGDRLAFKIDDFDVDLGDYVLRPLLSSSESSLDIADRRHKVGDTSTSTDLTLLINKDISLNED